MLEKNNLENFKSDSLHFPNVNSLMKISLGLILFTAISTALVYAEMSSNDYVVQIVDGAFLEENIQHFDNTLFSSSPGGTITVINNDSVSHKLVSGTSNSNRESNVNYETFLICEFNEEDNQTYANQTDENLCDFNKDNRIITDIIPPGDSISFSFSDVGTYRIIDPDYPWMEFVFYSFSDSKSDNVNSGFLTNEKIPESSVESESEHIVPHIQTISVSVDGEDFDFQYTAMGLTVNEIESDIESMSLIFSVNVFDSNGKLNVTFDRIFFDSIFDGVDDSFFVLSDGDETISRETQTDSKSRTLSIDVPFGTEELEIIGSEFGILKETPVIETPVIETPVIETPVIETPETNQCGPGTILENDVCVLDQRCGPGTILENDVCVLDSTPALSTQSSGTSKELIMSIAVAFGIAGSIGIVLALIARAHKKKN